MDPLTQKFHLYDSTLQIWANVHAEGSDEGSYRTSLNFYAVM